MKKRGFTLIELLAVIVILAIIALIATPIVMNVIENSRKGAAERSADNYMDAVETAVATEKLDGKELEGTYLINADGNLCTEAEGVSCTEPITIDMSGNKPNSGTIVIENGIVTTESTMTVGDYTVSYDETKKTFVATKTGEDNKEESETPEVTKICSPVTEATTGNIPTAGQYNYGDEYICDLGDGESRTFFVLEDGDNPTLTKGDGTLHYEGSNIGTADEGEVSLIMDRNIDDTTFAWCDQDGDNPSDNTCNADGAKAYLESQTSSWTVDVSLPTYDQIYAVNNSIMFTSTPWLYRNSDNNSSTTTPSGYWTSTAYRTSSSNAWYVNCDGYLRIYNNVDNDTRYGVRPVITISKDQL